MMRKRWRWAAFVLLWAAAPPLRADDAYDKLVKEFGAAQQKWYQQLQAQKEGETAPPNPVDEFLPKFRAYAEQHAGKPEAIPALAWIVQSVRPKGPDAKPPEDVRWALEQLGTHAADPAIGPTLQGLRFAAYSWGAAPLLPLFGKIVVQNPDKDVKANALFSDAFARYVGERGDERARDKSRRKAIELFRAILKDFADSDAAKKAGPYIFEAEHLQVGMKAPDFAGQNEQGEPVKLSNFKGRVVVIDFWGYW